MLSTSCARTASTTSPRCLEASLDRFRRTLALVLVFTSTGCARPETSSSVEPIPSDLVAAPRWLAFTETTPGTRQTLETVVRVEGSRSLAVKRVVLSDRARTDFNISTSRAPPFVLDAKGSMVVTVTHVPDGAPHAEDPELLITYGDASASEVDNARVSPGELRVPLVRRVVGQARLAASPDELVFGGVPIGMSKTLSLRIAAEGFGNETLTLTAIESDVRSIVPAPPSGRAIAIGAYDAIPIVFTPTDEAYVEGHLTFTSLAGHEPQVVRVRGTSIPTARINVTPSGPIDLGRLPVGATVERTLAFANVGSMPLSIEALEPSSVSETVTLTLDRWAQALTSVTSSVVVEPLSSRTSTMIIRAIQPGPIAVRLRIRSNDDSTPELERMVVGLVTRPRLAISPASIDFGVLPRGWSRTGVIEVRNVGYGPLEVSRIGLVAGSSALFSLKDTPLLPVKLEHDARLGFEVEIRAETEAELLGRLAIDTNDPETPSMEVPLAAHGVSCTAGCPIAHGSPTCADGRCAIERCDEHWFDVDASTANGCECPESAEDPGAFCADARDLGTLVDNDEARTAVSGVLPTTEDVDVYRFFAKDAGFDLFGDDYDVRIRLETEDPSMRLCVTRHDTDEHSAECVVAEEVCPPDRAYRLDGHVFGDESADFVVRVEREPGSPATCWGYTLSVSNG